MSDDSVGPIYPAAGERGKLGGQSVLVVGAGFAGAVYARMLAEHGFRVDVIDRRPHIAGNAFDETVSTGVRVHRYGPHLFHTNMRPVVDWLTRFGAFLPYEHRVEALLPGARYAPLPINRTTVNLVFGTSLQTEAEVKSHLARLAIPSAAPRNAAEHLNSRIGSILTDLFFRPYTKKMWGLDLEELDAAVVKRIPLRFDDEDRYFPDDVYQMLPAEGYTALFSNILDHDNIKIYLNTSFDRSLMRGYRHCFNSMAIDEYFGEMFGPLPYRSIRFQHRDEPISYGEGTTSVINFTDGRPYTRQTDWSRLPGHDYGMLSKTITLEQPCDYRENNFERYYPVKTSDGRNDNIYQKYRERAEHERVTTFIGRCGTYQYLDMHQVVNQSISGARAWITANAL
jgi:UDP-galactopyranose mutase